MSLFGKKKNKEESLLKPDELRSDDPHVSKPSRFSTISRIQKAFTPKKAPDKDLARSSLIEGDDRSDSPFVDLDVDSWRFDPLEEVDDEIPIELQTGLFDVEAPPISKLMPKAKAPVPAAKPRKRIYYYVVFDTEVDDFKQRIAKSLAERPRSKLLGHGQGDEPEHIVVYYDPKKPGKLGRVKPGDRVILYAHGNEGTSVSNKGSGVKTAEQVVDQLLDHEGLKPEAIEMKLYCCRSGGTSMPDAVDQAFEDEPPTLGYTMLDLLKTKSKHGVPKHLDSYVGLHAAAMGPPLSPSEGQYTAEQIAKMTKRLGYPPSHRGSGVPIVPKLQTNPFLPAEKDLDTMRQIVVQPENRASSWRRRYIIKEGAVVTDWADIARAQAAQSESRPPVNRDLISF